MKTVHTLVIGAGQAGLATGWHLSQHHVDLLILEASERAGGAWRSYYDSLELFSPAGYSALPGMPFPGPQGRYPHRDEVVGYLDAYVRKFRLPVHTSERVTNVSRKGNGFEAVTTSGRRYFAQTLVAASGAFGTPHIPAITGHERFRGHTLHSAAYRNASELANQHVIVIGRGNSAVQIATEISEVTRVTIATRRPIRFAPQRLLGLDFHFWVKWTGLERTRWLKDQGTPVLDDGKYRRVIETGRVKRREIFTHMTEHGVVWTDGTEEPADVLLFATGFRPNAAYLADLDAICGDLGLNQRNGISVNIPGLYFVGFPGQRNFASATLRGVGADANYIMRDLLQHVNRAD